MRKLAVVFMCMTVSVVIVVGLMVLYENVSGSYHTYLGHQNSNSPVTSMPRSDKTYVMQFDTPGQQG